MTKTTMTLEEWEEYKKRHYKHYESKLDQLLKGIWEQKEAKREEILEEIRKGKKIDIEKLVETLPFGNIVILPARKVRALKDTGLPSISEREIKARLLEHSIYEYKRLIPYKSIQNLFNELKMNLVEDGYNVEYFECPPIACILLKTKHYREWAKRTYGLAKTEEEYGFQVDRKLVANRSLGNISMGFYSFLIVLKRLKKTKDYTGTIKHELLHIFEGYLKLPAGTLTRKYGF